MAIPNLSDLSAKDLILYVVAALVVISVTSTALGFHP